MTLPDEGLKDPGWPTTASAPVRPRLRRLKKRADFLRIAASGRKAVSPGLVLQAAPGRNDGQEDPEIGLGFTVSRKVGNAVARNRARRRLHALATAVMPEKGHAGMDYVIIGRAAAVKRPFGKLRTDLLDALERLERSVRTGRR